MISFVDHMLDDLCDHISHELGVEKYKIIQACLSFDNKPKKWTDEKLKSVMNKPKADFSDCSFWQGNKTKTRKFFSESIKNHPLGKIDVKENLHNYLLELFQFHSECEEKLGCGVDFFDVQKDGWGNKFIFIHRLDKSVIDVSWTHCFNPITSIKLLKGAMREAIEYQIDTFRKKMKNEKIYTCQLCDVHFARSNIISHVDHYPISFEKLFQEFTNNWKKHSDLPTFFHEKANTYQPLFFEEDLQFKTEWIDFHDKKANFRLLCRTCNLKAPKK
jgi:Protein of unknown function (DUF3223)